MKRKEKDLPNGFYTKAGVATDNLRAIFLCAYMFNLELKPGKACAEAAEYAYDKLSKKDPKNWKRKSREGMIMSIAQQLMWGVTNQKKILPGSAMIYIINTRTAKEMKNIAKYV